MEAVVAAVVADGSLIGRDVGIVGVNLFRRVLYLGRVVVVVVVLVDDEDDEVDDEGESKASSTRFENEN